MAQINIGPFYRDDENYRPKAKSGHAAFDYRDSKGADRWHICSGSLSSLFDVYHAAAIQLCISDRRPRDEAYYKAVFRGWRVQLEELRCTHGWESWAPYDIAAHSIDRLAKLAGKERPSSNNPFTFYFWVEILEDLRQ